MALRSPTTSVEIKLTASNPSNQGGEGGSLNQPKVKLRWKYFSSILRYLQILGWVLFWELGGFFGCLPAEKKNQVSLGRVGGQPALHRKRVRKSSKIFLGLHGKIAGAKLKHFEGVKRGQRVGLEGVLKCKDGCIWNIVACAYICCYVYVYKLIWRYGTSIAEASMSINTEGVASEISVWSKQLFALH